jgi:hypothetical protein
VIRLGGATEFEVKESKDRFDDATHAGVKVSNGFEPPRSGARAERSGIGATLPSVHERSKDGSRHP